MELNKKIGKNIKDARVKVNLDQRDLGEPLGVTQAAISHFENGIRTVSYEGLLAIAKTIGGIKPVSLLPDELHKKTSQVKR